MQKMLLRKSKMAVRRCFWHELWLGEEVLKNCSSRLFNLALEKSVFVADMVVGIGVE